MSWHSITTSLTWHQMHCMQPRMKIGSFAYSAMYRHPKAKIRVDFPSVQVAEYDSVKAHCSAAVASRANPWVPPLLQLHIPISIMG